MKLRQTRLIATMLCAGPAMAFATPAAASDADWATASGVVRTALVAAAIGVPAVDGDWQGTRQAVHSVGAAFLVTVALKETFPSVRPDGNGNDSFPSGHTSASFAAAATLTRRRGLAIGIPAHIAAAFVGVARVQAHRHRWGDVLVGAVIGEASGQLLTSRRQTGIAVIPWGDLSGGGITVAARF